MNKTAFIFPGQGSQFVGMGQEFAESNTQAREIFELAEQVTGKPVASLAFEGPMEELTQTVNLQPAITAVNLATLAVLEEKGMRPDFVAGHSLGEYSALAAAGVITPGQALTLTNRRGELMQAAADQNPGAMVAVLGLSRARLEEITRAVSGETGQVVVVANHNTAEQIVLSGEKEAVDLAAQKVAQAEARAIPLAVSGAWHSPLMEEAAQAFADELMSVEFKQASMPVYLNVTAEPETDPDAIKKIMRDQIISPVRWFDIVENMLKSGVGLFVEVGPKKVLSGMNRKIVPKGEPVKTVNVENVEGLDKAALFFA